MLQAIAVPPAAEEEWWPPRQGAWTYEDYVRMPDNGFRYEVIEGDLFMSPAPTVQHQRVIFALVKVLANYLDTLEEHGEAFAFPIDVNLPEVSSLVQPDIVYISHERIEIVETQKIEGAPDLIIEVLSPKTAEYDRTTKFALYAAAGVQEFWLVDPEQCLVQVYVLRGQAFALLGQYGRSHQIRSEVLTDFSVAAGDICS